MDLTKFKDKKVIEVTIKALVTSDKSDEEIQADIHEKLSVPLDNLEDVSITTNVIDINKSLSTNLFTTIKSIFGIDDDDISVSAQGICVCGEC